MASRESRSTRILPWPGGMARRSNEREFLAAALEIVETPPSPLGRTAGYLIVIFFCLALLWSWFSRVDVIATAAGRIVPTGMSKVVQPLDSGIIRAILVRDGQHVRVGDPLIQLDDTIARADWSREWQALLSAQLGVARLTALERFRDPARAAASLLVPPGAKKVDAERARRLTMAQSAEQSAKLAGIDQQIDRALAQERETEVGIKKLQVTMPIIEAKRDLYQHLLKLEFANRLAYFNAEQALLEAQQDLAAQMQKLTGIEAQESGLRKQRDQTQAEYARKLLEDLFSAEQRASEHGQRLIQAQRKLDESLLRAPVAGFVQELAVHTVGGVVTPAEPLLVVVPEDQNLVVEANLKNDDVGFVRAGQEAQIKVQAYDFTRYGLLHGQVSYLSRDAVSHTRQAMSQAKTTPADDRQDSSPTGSSPDYVARIALSSQSMIVDRRRRNLKPGMIVTAEIKTGSRRVLSYLLSPVRKYAEDAIRER